MWKITSALLLCSISALLGVSTTVESRSLDSKIFNCPKPDGFFGYEDQCVADFFICVAGVPNAQKCPGTTVFDSEKGYCVEYEEASCRERPFECPNKDSGFYPIQPGKCSVNFWACVAGQAYLLKCEAEGQVFDEVKGCVRFSEASCSANDFMCPSDGFFARPGECVAQYWSCVGGVAYPLTCSGTNAVFDEQKGYCVSYGQSSCRDPFVCPRENGRFPDESGKCLSYYWHCISFQAFSQTCPGTSVFDPEKEYCVAEAQSTCHPDYFDCSRLEDGLHTRPGLCSNKYWYCIAGESYPDTCVGNSIFDPVKRICVAPEVASCRP